MQLTALRLSAVVRLTKGFEVEIILHWNNDYVDVSVKDSGTTIDLGLHNEKERRELAKMLREAAEDLMDGLEDA